MIEEKTCHNCGNKNCNVYYSIVKKDCKRHYETYEYMDFDCVNHDKWEELKVEEIRTDNTETLKNALERIKEEVKAPYPSYKHLFGESIEQTALRHSNDLINSLRVDIDYAKAVIQDLLDNSDEYARQRAIDYLKENENDR